MNTVMIVGTVAAMASVASFAPQAWKIIRTRRTEGLSAGMFALTAFAFLCWTSFGILKQEWALMVPNSICLLMSGFILMMIVLPPRKTEEVAASLDPES